jgi:hypothetical protein
VASLCAEDLELVDLLVEVLVDVGMMFPYFGGVKG